MQCKLGIGDRGLAAAARLFKGRPFRHSHVGCYGFLIEQSRILVRCVRTGVPARSARIWPFAYRSGPMANLGRPQWTYRLAKGASCLHDFRKKGLWHRGHRKWKKLLLTNTKSEHTSYFDEDGRPTIMEQPPRQTEERFITRERKSQHPEKKHDP